MDFFEFSRCESGEYNFDFQAVRVQDVLCEAVAAYYTDFSDRGIEPVIRMDEAIPCMIADENALKRIYQNLIQNTLKHGVGSVEIFLEYKDNKIISGFTNDAPDLTKEDLEHLFERSFTADKMRSRGNTGFGLSIVKSLVEQMHGTISAALSDNKFSIIISWSNLSK
jgi:signal transduction histidine kinase